MVREIYEPGNSVPMVAGRHEVNLKRDARVMHTHGLLLARKPVQPRPQRRHEGRVAVDASNRRWCADGFECRCDSGESVRATFALDCCDREAMSWAATTAARTGDIVRDVMLAACGASVRAITAKQPHRVVDR